MPSAWPFTTSGSAFAADPDVPLRLRNAHTGEHAAVHLFDGQGWNKKSLIVCDWLMRDHRENDARRMDPRLYAGLYILQRAAGRDAEVTILSAFRTRKTNNMLRRKGIGAAAESYHMRARAVDFRIGSVSPVLLARSTRALGLGGTGLYSSFVHMDTGPSRTWGRSF